ncbi:hypothetical protein [Rhodococcus sp. T7]|uniref:hypothetical protein n=1 Tax=Rhodococcus sp. T7 TaxID=627444 RepID=UPI001358AA4A|nr:hypothetical protein [Rhodococcus sp. T7]KAF0966642.1 hypothetical protein MLGJGCBP_00191 [Rhodococcus sp. T7]
MTRGLGLRIGTAHAVAAIGPDDAGRIDSVLTRRSTLTFGPDSAVRLGDPPDGAMVLAEFAHRIGEVLVAGDGHRYIGQDLVAVAVHCLVAETNLPTDTPAVLTYPAVYTTEAVRDLRRALDRAGLAGVGLVPEPVAALAWYEAEHGLLVDGFVLVCHVDAGGLDLTILAAGTTGGPDPIVGRPLRSTEFTSRPPEPTLHAVSSLHDLAADSLDVAGLHASDLVLVLLTGAETSSGLRDRLEELDAPVICPPHPETASARGAALLAAASPFQIAPPGQTVRPRRGRHLSIAAAVVAAAALMVPSFTADTRPDPRHDDTAAASRPSPQHGFRLVERGAPAHLSSASAVPAPTAAATVILDANPAQPAPRIVVLTAQAFLPAQPFLPSRPAPVDPVTESPTDSDTTIEPTTPKPLSDISYPSPPPAPSTGPTPAPTPTTDPDESTVPTEPPPTPADETDPPPEPTDPSMPPSADH